MKHHRHKTCGNQDGLELGHGRGWAGRGHRGHARHMRPEGERGGLDGERRGRRGGGRMFEHGAMRWLLLSLIAEKPSHGYELIKQIEARMGGTYAPSPGVIYPSLTLLEDMGALTVEAAGGKKLHVITDEGRRLLADNAETVAHIERKMAHLGGRSERPAQVQEAIDAFRLAVRTRLSHDEALTQDQAEALARLIRETTIRIGEI